MDQGKLAVVDDIIISVVLVVDQMHRDGAQSKMPLIPKWGMFV